MSSSAVYLLGRAGYPVDPILFYFNSKFGSREVSTSYHTNKNPSEEKFETIFCI